MNSCQSNRFAKPRYSNALAVLMALVFGITLSTSAFAGPRIKHVITKQHNVSPAMGRELYFALPQNYEDQSGKYFYLYVTSAKQTTVHVETSMGTMVQSISPYKVAAFNIPLGWEVKSNNVVEDKAVRVYSTDADVTGYLMSHNPYTSDGMYCFPTIGWGQDYVVAAYAGLDAGGADYPAEFVVVANQNNTLVDITPSCDLRNGGSNAVAHPAGQKFSVTLQKGQCIQYKSTAGGDVTSQDVTGTIVHGSNPVGVIGASQCPDIPLGYPYCDHVLDMMPPTRTWAKTYYTAPSFARLKGDTFLAIGSVPGQKLMRQGANTGIRQEAILDAPYWVNDIDEGSKWYSDKPFFLVQYLNSSTWDCSSCGFGDPAEVVVNPVEEYSKVVVFQTPTSQGSQSPYVNYVNIIVNKNAAASTKFGSSLTSMQSVTNFTKITVDGQYEIYRAANIAPGTHIVTSDSGVGVYIYGYGSYESYAWTGSFGTATYGSPDTVAPEAYTSGNCFDAHVEVTDTERLASKINQVRLDSSYNMAYLVDPNYSEGLGIPNSYYDMFVLDSTVEAYMRVATLDLAGNQTIVTSTYTPQVAVDSPGVISFGTGTLGGAAVEKYLYITNTGKTQFKIASLSLLLGNQGFKIDSADLSPLAVGEVRLIRIGFVPVKASTVSDTVVFGDECIKQKAILIGSGGAPDFAVTDDDFGPILQGTSKQNTLVHIINLSTIGPITITNVTVDNPMFTFDDAGLLPLTLKPGETRPVKFSFQGQLPLGTIGRHFGHGTFVSDLAGSKSDSLYGTIIAPAQAFFEDTTVTVDCAQPGDTVHLSFYVIAQGTGTAKSKITSWSHTASTDPNFVNFHAEFQGQPVTAPYSISPNDKLFLLEDYVVPTNTSGTKVDAITAFDADGKPIKTVSATLSTTYRTQQLLDPTIDFGTSNFRGPIVKRTSRVVNTAQDDLTISSVDLMPGGPYNKSYSIAGSQIRRGGTTVNVTLPTVLKYLDTLVTTIAFDPSVSLDLDQSARIASNTNGCLNPGPSSAFAKVIVHGSSAQGFDAATISACSQLKHDVVIYNDKPKGVIDTIIDAQIIGANAANFTIPNQAGITFDSGSITIPVTFIPTSSSNYTATVQVRLRSNHNTDTVVFADITTSAATALATSNSTFASSDQTATTGSIIKLPIDFNVNKNGISTPLSDMNINGVRFTYTFNQDLLSIQGSNPSNAAQTQAAIANAVTGLPAGWTVDPANSSITGNKLVVTMTGSKNLDESITNFGTISFKVTLPKVDTMKNVTLVSMDLLTNGTPVTGCATTKVTSGNFGLIYSCGEKTLQGVMNGNNSFAFIQPVTPNPSTGGNITFTYATRGSAPVSLYIFDVLGNVVARVVDNVPHEAGVFQVNYNASNLPSGTYTYRLSVRGVTSSKQLVITK